jgi:hypothetical protein
MYYSREKYGQIHGSWYYMLYMTAHIVMNYSLGKTFIDEQLVLYVMAKYTSANNLEIISWTMSRRSGWALFFFEKKISWSIVCSLITTGKNAVAVHCIFAVCFRTAKISLPCARRKTHGKDFGHGKQRHERTAKIWFTATTEESARQRKLHGKGPT